MPVDSDHDHAGAGAVCRGASPRRRSRGVHAGRRRGGGAEPPHDRHVSRSEIRRLGGLRYWPLGGTPPTPAVATCSGTGRPSRTDRPQPPERGGGLGPAAARPRPGRCRRPFPPGRPTRYLDGLTVYVASPRREICARRRTVARPARRTVGDCLRHLPATDAPSRYCGRRPPPWARRSLAVAAVLRGRGTCVHEPLRRAVRWGGRRGRLESVSRWYAWSGVPLGEPRWNPRRTLPVRGASASWEEHGIVGEADRRGRHATPDLGGVSAAGPAQERPARIGSAISVWVIRWGRPICASGRVVAAAFQRARSRHAGSRFTGRARRSPAIELAFPGGRAR